MAQSNPQTLDLINLNHKFESAHPRDIIHWAVANFPQRLAQASAFSILVVTHMLYREVCPTPPVPVLFLDTLHHFQATLDTVERATRHYDLDLRVYHVKGVSSREGFAARYGERLWDNNVNRFHYLTKVEPLERAMREMEVMAWFTGRRRDQSASRRQMPIFELDGQGRLKINPLATWTRKQVWAYTFNQGILYNPLHDQGYTSIGDEPLTTPIVPGEHERAGRWRGSAKMECGIHI